MSRHRFCTSDDWDGFIEELAQELWEDGQVHNGAEPWAAASPSVRQHYRNLAADTLRFLEHDHG